MTTRERQLIYASASSNNTRSANLKQRTDEGGLVYEASTIASVNSTNSFDDSAGGLPVFEAGQLVQVVGSGFNSRTWRVVSSDADSLVVDCGVVRDEAEGNSIMIRLV